MKPNKIKRITLDSFRAFPSTKTLSFEHGESVADIVVIYAANGTGKTSTIEGVEWATTGKISRIDNIIANITSRNRNPKEGNILKNRQSGLYQATVTVELENGDCILRKTKPKSSRNHDYCSGILESTVKDAEKFNNNILSQGAINRFSYEASNGNLFNSLINSKGNSGDIEVYTQLNTIKTKLESNNGEKKTEISLLNKLIKDEEKSINELKERNINNSNLSASEEYGLFRDNFISYRDISEMNANDIANYISELVVTFKSLKVKLLEFDIDLYKKYSREAYLAKKIIECQNEVVRNKTYENELLIDLNKVKRDIQWNGLFIDADNLDVLNNQTLLFNEFSKDIIKHENKVSKLSSVYNNIYNNSLNINVDELRDKENKIHLSKGIIMSLFGDLYEKEFILEHEKNITSKIDSALSTIVEKRDSLSKTVFINENTELSYVKEFNKKSFELDNLNIKLLELTREKEKIKSFEEKLVIIKSYVVDVINDKKLSNCPSCGTKFENMTSLMEAVNNISTDSEALVDGAIGTLTKTKSEIALDVDRLNKIIETLTSKQKIKYSNDINILIGRKEHVVQLYSLLSSLKVQYVNVKLSSIQIQLDEILLKLNKKISVNLRKKEKYTKWTVNINSLIKNQYSAISEKKIKLNGITSLCFEKYGLDMDGLILKLCSGHVTLFERENLITLEKKLARDLDSINSSLLSMNGVISKLYSNSGFSHDLEINKYLESSLFSKKTIRSNYNYIKKNIKAYVISDNFYFTEMVTSIEEKFSTYLQSMQLEKNISDKKQKIAEYEEQRNLKIDEFDDDANKLSKVNASLVDAMEYFSELASSSINNDILNDMFMYVEPHLKYDKITFKVDLNGNNKGIYIQTHSDANNESTTPIYYLSEAQINILSICIFLANHARKIDFGINSIIIDDPVQSMDDLNSYALIDLCKLFTRRFKKQIIITTHNRSFFNLFKDKLPESRYSTKYITL
ncbi:hypothetical protein GW590_16850 [Rahnella sp. SAP-1]|uniref:Rad50/SbcC-type AAA domain-containing protein n=1 Tax=Rouxiella aceris TaxID=2703884 RepID=A0A848MMK6_9GAMM|nr:AAA family ATPase [Rouxiella aceris]NMP28533.1 hypothetical protein [Rouxiella aceris]